jgi:DNA-binding HxlR family transcriptional regulator
MKRTALDHHHCSIARALDDVGEWWTLLIVRDVAYGVRRFAEIQGDLGISANVLAERLESLVTEGIVEKRVYQQRPQRAEYRLTKKGTDLVPVLLALMQWGDRWKWPDGRGPVQVLHEECGRDVHVEIRCQQCQRQVPPEELRAKARGGFVQAPREPDPGSVSGRRLLSDVGGVSINT